MAKHGSLKWLRENSHANPLVLESHAQLLASYGYDVQATHIRLLSLAIHDPEEYQRQHDKLKAEAQEILEKNPEVRPEVRAYLLRKRDHRYYDDEPVAKRTPPKRTRSRTPDALYNREAEPGSPEYDYMHRYDSPDNERDTMG